MRNNILVFYYLTDQINLLCDRKCLHKINTFKLKGKCGLLRTHRNLCMTIQYIYIHIHIHVIIECLTHFERNCGLIVQIFRT